MALVGCAGASVASDPFLSSGPQPRVEDCALIQQATPAKFVLRRQDLYGNSTHRNQIRTASGRQAALVNKR
jgi:hypothetical protein